MCCKHWTFVNSTHKTYFTLEKLPNWLEPFSLQGVWQQSTKFYTFDCIEWMDMHGFVYLIKVYCCVHQAASGLRSRCTAGRHADTCGVCVRVLWRLFVWTMAEFCMATVCTACVSCWVSGVSDVCLCRAAVAFDDQPAPLPADIFVRAPFEKVVHIIHRRGHMPSSRPPPLHPHNARCHAHSCQLVPVCLPMPITAVRFTVSAHNSRVLCPRCGHM